VNFEEKNVYYFSILEILSVICTDIQCIYYKNVIKRRPSYYNIVFMLLVLLVYTPIPAFRYIHFCI